MLKTNTNIAKSYYQAMNDKDLNAVISYLHPEIKFTSPFGTKQGKDEVTEAVKGFLTIFNTLKVNEISEAENYVMLTYTIDCPQPIGTFRAAVLMYFDENLISSIELFFNASIFDKR